MGEDTCALINLEEEEGEIDDLDLIKKDSVGLGAEEENVTEASTEKQR